MLSFFKRQNSTKDLTQLELKTEQQRKEAFLKPLVVGLLGIQVITLSLMLIPPFSSWYWFVVLGASIPLNIAALYLVQQNRVELATHIFCHNFNFLVFLTFFINIVIERDFERAGLVGYSLALTILLAGMLINTRANVGFAVLNAVLIFAPYFIVSDTVILALRNSFSIAAFFLLIALISWLYQTTLNQAHARLSMAQYQLMQTQLIQRDMEIARELQQQLYPMPPENSQELAIAARSEPAQETSGDFYDFIELSPQELGVVVADVTGKSLAAALIMAMTRSTLRSEARRSGSPANVLRQTNQVLHDDASVDQMITTFYGILNTELLTFRFANAGHIYPILKRNGQVRDLELNGLPLKAFSEAQYEEKTTQLFPRDQLILVSDGLIEAMNVKHELFGFERLKQVLYEVNSINPQNTIRELWQAVETFRGDVEQQDDMTLVVITIEEEPVKQEVVHTATPEKVLV